MYTVNAILWDYQNGQLVSTTQTLFSTSSQDERPVENLVGSLELNEGGSIAISLAYGHPLYNTMEPMQVYIQVLEDGNELFYGRINSKSDPTFSGLIEYQAEGALSFLNDSELPIFPAKSGSKQGKEHMTAEAFFRWCIDQHNASVNDPRRQFTVGMVTADGRSEENDYQISSYSQTKGTLTNETTGKYGGFLRVRSDGHGGHLIDWIQDYGRLDQSPITLGENVISFQNEVSVEDLHTVLHPVGEKGIELNPPTIDMFDAAMMAKLGRIVKTVSFSKATDAAALQKEANDYIAVYGGIIPRKISIQLIDMHYLDGTTPKIHLGDMYDNIHGVEGNLYTVSHMDINFLHPENDTFEFKNRQEIERSNSGGISGGSMSGAVGGMGGGIGALYKFYEEESNTSKILAEELIITSHNIELISSDVSDAKAIAESAYDGITDIYGSALFKNADQITEVAGQFRVTDNYYADWPDYVSGTTYHVGDHIRWRAPNETVWSGYTCIKDTNGTPVTDKNAWVLDSGRKKVTLINGASMEIDDINGHRVTVGQVIPQIGEKADEALDRATRAGEDAELILGSALWTQQEQIVGVSGMYEIVTDPGTGEERLVVINGGGMSIRKEGVEYGLYLSPSGDPADTVLTGGLMVNHINAVNWPAFEKNHWYSVGDRLKVGGKGYVCLVAHMSVETGSFIDELNAHPTYWREGTGTTIRGDMVDIDARQVRIGDASNVATWMSETGQDIDDLKGLVVDNFTAHDARIHYLETDHVTVGDMTAIQEWASETDDWKDNTDDTLEQHYDLIADRALIRDLNAVSARVHDLEVDYVKASEVNSDYITSKLNRSSIITANKIDTYIGVFGSISTSGGDSIATGSLIRNVSLEDTGNGTYKIVKLLVNGDITEYPFSDGWIEAAACVGSDFTYPSGKISLAVPSGTRSVSTTKEVGLYNVVPTQSTSFVSSTVTHNSTDPANAIPGLTVSMQLKEHVNGTNSNVTLETTGTSLTKGSVSTSATYKAGWDHAPSTVTVGGRTTSAATVIKSLTYDEKWEVWFKVKDSSGTDHESTYTVKAPSDRYSTGYANADAASLATLRKTTTETIWQITVTRGDGTTKTIALNVSSIYTDARSGYTKGIFNGPYSVTPIGSGQTVLIPNGQGDKILRGDTVTVTPIGTAQTITPIGAGETVLVPNNSGGYILRGDPVSITPIDTNNKLEHLTATTRFKAGSAASYYAGNGAAYSEATRYTRGGAETLYEAGTPVTLYPAQEAVTYYRGNGQRYKEETWYKKGTSHTAIGSYAGQISGKSVYYAGSVFYAVGDSATVLVKDSSGSKHLRGDTVTVTPVGPGLTITPIGTPREIHQATGGETVLIPNGQGDKILRGDVVNVTLQGDSDSVYINASSGGETYYKAGSAQTLYQGNGSKYTTATRYPAGNQVTLYPAGTPVTYYRGNGSKYSEATRYPAGTAFNYYTKS